MKPLVIKEQSTDRTFKTGIDKCLELMGMLILVRIIFMTGCMIFTKENQQ